MKQAKLVFLQARPPALAWRAALRAAKRCGLAAVFVCCALRSPAFAQTWSGAGADNNFSTANNWSPAGAPANNGTASLTFSGSTRLSPNVDTPWSLGSLAFSSSAGAFKIGGQTLTLGAGGMTTSDRSTSPEIISAPLVLSASQIWNDLSQPNGNGFWVQNTINLNGSNLTLTATGSSNGSGGGPLDGAISGTGNITVTGGQFDLRTNNTFVGSVNLNGGALQVESASGLSSANTPLNFNGGELAVDSSASSAIPQNAFIASGGATLQSDVPQTVTTTFSGVYSGPGGVDISTISGAIALTGANTYSGGTTVSALATLTVSTSSLPGNVTLLGSVHGFATLQFQQNADGAYSGAISGDGLVAKYGTGALSFSGTISATAANTVSLQINGGRFTMAGGNNVFSSVPLVISGGVFDLNGTNQVVAQLSGTSGAVALGSGVLTFGGNNSSVTYQASISGAGGITKVGTGTETFMGASTYTGLTRVNAGTLLVQGSLSGNGSSTVLVNAGTDFTSASIDRQVTSSLDGIGSTAAGSAAGILGSSADVRAGKYTGQFPGSVNMQWRVRAANETPGSGQTPLISDVLNLAGLPQSSTGNRLQSDAYVLQMTYNSGLLGASEGRLAAGSRIYLGWLNNTVTPNVWQSATSGNFGAGAAGDVFLNVQSSWDAFASSHQITDATVGSYLGSYGVDPTSHAVWAVLNYDASYFDVSQFAVVPEPSSLALLVIGVATIGGIVLRKRT